MKRENDLSNEYRDKKNELLAKTVIKGLESRNMKGFYAPTRETAVEIASALIPKGGRVIKGGSYTVYDVGLDGFLKAGDFEYIDRNKCGDKEAADIMAASCDVFIGSCNAITRDGILINIDGPGNRIASYAHGPKKVIMVAGMNKICADLDSALKRARNTAAVMNAHRFGLNTPCMKTGYCMDCKSPDTICCQFLITRFSYFKDRINVILVNDDLGF